MKIIHVVESLASAGGGLPAAVKSLIKLQQSFNYKVICAVTGLATPNNEFDKNTVFNLRDSSILSSIFNLNKLCLSIKRHHYDFVHIHGVWNLTYLVICITCRLAGVKYVVTTHGQLLSTILESDSIQKRLKKKIYYQLFARQILQGAFKIHVSSENERSEFSLNKILSKKIVLIPHIMDDIFFDIKLDRDSSHFHADKTPEFKDILFVGRLDVRKGILDLIDGFASSGLSLDWRLRIVGPNSDPDFMKLMLRKISSIGMVERILIEKPIYGDLRIDLYLSCYVFCLPSYSEAPGLVNIEAALVGRPVITTPYTGLLDIKEFGGVLCDTGQESIGLALREVASWTENEYFSRSKRIQSWAKSEFSLDIILPRWKKFYTQ
ncbi:MAG: glycosyltransferase [Oxalobacteraceae bacterium]|nr:glycosyltransferase [Oxalobacteraceae bacterium]